jgi:hypothetical protein
MSRVSDQLEVLAALLYADPARLRFRDRLRIERCLFRVASAASMEVGRRLLGLDESRNRTALRGCKSRRLARFVLDASNLKARLVAVSTIDAYVHRTYAGALGKGRRRALRRLAVELQALASKSRRGRAPAKSGPSVRLAT